MERNSLFSLKPRSRQTVGSRLTQRLSRSNAQPSAPAINDQPPPSYTVADVNPNNLTQDQMIEMARNEKEADVVIDSDITWAFSQLDIKADKDGFPTSEHCLAHLKLLEAFYALKDEVAYTDGAFSIFDSRAPGTEESVAGNEQATRKRLEALAQIREKRWALFVARAVDRFEVWWTKMLAPMDEAASRDPGIGAGVLGRLTTAVMTTPQAFENFVDSSKFGIQSKEWTWTADMLPPLGECPTHYRNLLLFVRSINCCRRSHGLACLHAQSSQLSRGLHALGFSRYLVCWNAMASDQLFDRRPFPL